MSGVTALSPACWASGGSHISLPCQASHPNGGLHLENRDPLVKSTNRVYPSSHSLPSSKYPVANYKAKSCFHTCASGYPTAPALLTKSQPLEQSTREIEVGKGLPRSHPHGHPGDRQPNHPALRSSPALLVAPRGLSTPLVVCRPRIP